MKTLKLKNEDKKETIRKINKFRLENKNLWYQVEIIEDNYTHLIKAFNTWVQICRTYKNNNFIFNNPSAMDISVTQFKKHIENVLSWNVTITHEGTYYKLYDSIITFKPH